MMTIEEDRGSWNGRSKSRVTLLQKGQKQLKNEIKSKDGSQDISLSMDRS